MSNTEFGKLITDPATGRDAIHIACAPVIAESRLFPGQRIGWTDRDADKVDLAGGDAIGIVDPFLMDAINPGERFWMFLLPNTITSLRHEWTHPAFKDQPQPKPVSADEQWIRNFADKVGLGYDVLMEGARDWVASKERGRYGEYLCFGGLLEGESVPDEFWTHYEAVTGKTVDEDHRGSFFTCSC